MGCTASSEKKADPKRNVELVKASWATVKGAFDLQTVGDLFYATLFEQNRAYTKTLFKGVDHKTQAKKLIEMIDAAVGMLDDLDKLVPILEDLGERHGAYGVEDKDYAPVGAALIATLKKGLGEKLTEDDKAAWVWVYGVIETTMQEGAKTEKGQRLLAEYKEKKAAEQKKTFAAVQASWATVKKAFKLQDVGDLFYATLFEQNPEYTKTLFKGVDHKKQAKKLIEMIDAAVGMLSEVEKLVPILEDLGERHGAYGVEDKDYAPVGAALIATLQKGLAKKLTKTDEAAWVEVYGIIETTMQKGAKTEKGQRLLAEYKEKKAAEQKKAFEAVQASWATVKGAFELQAVGDLFYATLFEQNPEYTKTLFKGVDHKKQAKKLIEMIDAAVGMLSEVEKLVPILEDLGERHGAYGVEDKDYAPVGAALIATLKKGLGEKLTDKDQESWVMVYGIIETTMQKGAKTEKGQRLLAEYKEKKAKKPAAKKAAPKK